MVTVLLIARAELRRRVASLVALAALLLASLVALPPGWLATRRTPAASLRSE